MKNRRRPPLLLSLVAWSLFANASTTSHAQTRPIPVRTAYSALSAGIGSLWLSHENGHFRKHGLDSTPQLKQADLKKFIDDRFVKAR